MEWNDEILFESDEETPVNIQEDDDVEDAQDAQDDVAQDEPQVDDEPVADDAAEEPEGDEEPTEAFMEGEAVNAYLKGRKLNPAIAERLARGTYANEGELQGAVEAELAYVKQVTRSGKPFKVGAQERAADPPKVTIAERDEKLRKVNERWLGR